MRVRGLPLSPQARGRDVRKAGAAVAGTRRPHAAWGPALGDAATAGAILMLAVVFIARAAYEAGRLVAAR